MSHNKTLGANGGPGISAGTQLNRTYQIDQRIATGGMGEIYSGHTIETKDRVAIKMILPEFAGDETVLELFRREAKVLHNLSHEAVVRYFLFAYDDTVKRHYLAMEYVDGPTLSDVISKGALDIQSVNVLRHRVASGLEEAHKNGIIHRDISPDNIILPESDVGRAKIIDFGIARSVQSKDGTIIGDGFAGKKIYVSPEQVGLFGGNVTSRSDIYSFGLVLAAALRGYSINMGGHHADVVEKRKTIPNLDGIHPTMVPLLKSMLQPDPSERMESMAKVAAYTAGGSLDGDSGGQFSQTMQIVFGAVAALVLFASVGIGGYFLLGSPSEPDVEPEPVPLPDPAPVPEPDPAPVPDPNPLPDPDPSPLPIPEPDLLPNPDPVPPPPILSPAAEFISRFNNEDCFHVFPINVSPENNQLTGYGSSMDRLRDFYQEFKDTHFEPDLGGRVVSNAQCPAIDFLSDVGGIAGVNIDQDQLGVEKDRLSRGDSLRGFLNIPAAQYGTVLLIDDQGNVSNLGRYSQSVNTGLEFAKRIDDQMTGESRPYLLFGMSTTEPVSVSLTDTTADRLFPSLLSDLDNSGQNAIFAVRLLRVGQ